jgi:hypothetical protein
MVMSTARFYNQSVLFLFEFVVFVRQFLKRSPLANIFIHYLCNFAKYSMYVLFSGYTNFFVPDV